MPEVFNRYEKKYILTQNLYAPLLDLLSEHMEPDYYAADGGEYSVLTLYYDTPQNLFIRTSLAKPRYKEKVRLRAYETPSLDSLIYAEVKKKVSGLVNKRRSLIKLSEAYTFLETGEIPELDPLMNRQVINELSYIALQNTLIPSVMLSYDRVAFHGKGDNHDLRISFDRNIRSRRNDLRLENGFGGELLIPSDKVLMEVKVAAATPAWLTKILSEYSLYSRSFSKYGSEYMNQLKNVNGDVICCVE